MHKCHVEKKKLDVASKGIAMCQKSENMSAFGIFSVLSHQAVLFGVEQLHSKRKTEVLMMGQ